METNDGAQQRKPAHVLLRMHPIVLRGARCSVDVQQSKTKEDFSKTRKTNTYDERGEQECDKDEHRHPDWRRHKYHLARGTFIKQTATRKEKNKRNVTSDSTTPTFIQQTFSRENKQFTHDGFTKAHNAQRRLQRRVKHVSNQDSTSVSSTTYERRQQEQRAEQANDDVIPFHPRQNTSHVSETM
jgi:hypothetical protein